MAWLAFTAERNLRAQQYYEQYRQVTEPSARSLWLGIRIAAATGDRDSRDSYGLLLKNLFEDSPEYRLWTEFTES